MPARVVFIGGGYVSFEFARLAQLAGATVTVVHRSAHVLKGFDPSLAGMLVERYRALGIDVRTDTPVQRVAGRLGAVSVVTPDGEIGADLVVHGAGRVPDLDDLALVAGGVAHTSRGVTVDANLRSVSEPSVWAAGDAAAVGTPLTPVAAAQGEIVAAGVLGRPKVFDGSLTPSVVFTDPPIARVGLGAAGADDDPTLEVRDFDMSGWYTQTRVGNTHAGARLVVERATGRLRGAHVLGVEADGLINVLAVALHAGMTLADLGEMTWAYPTPAYDLNYLVGRY